MTNEKIPAVKLNFLDRVVCSIAPSLGLKRIQSRASINFMGESGYITPGGPKRSMRGYTPKALNADQDTLPKLVDLRAASRDLYYSTPVATAPIRRFRTNVIGVGLTFRSQLDRKLLGLSDEEADAKEQQIDRGFHSWANSRECDITRQNNFYELTGLAFLSQMLSGDIFSAYPRIKKTGQTRTLRIKLIEADVCSNPNNSMDTHKIAGGVEVNAHGAPIAYHFKKSRLIDSIDVTSFEWERVPIYGSKTGLRMVDILFDKERPGQRRGVPMLAPVLETLKQLTRYSLAEIDAAILNTFFSVFIKTLPEQGLQPGYIPGVSPSAGGSIVQGGPESSTNPADEKVYEMGRATINELDPNQSIELADPKHPVAGFDKFFVTYVKQLGAALEIPFEVLMLHFTASYSAARAALLEAWRSFIYKRFSVARGFCTPVQTHFMYDEVSSGRLSCPGFFSNDLIRSAWLAGKWIGPGKGMIDPLKEVKAAREKVAGRLTTREDEFLQMNETGGDWDGAMHRLSREDTLLKNLDLTEETELNTEEVPPTNKDKEDKKDKEGDD